MRCLDLKLQLDTNRQDPLPDDLTSHLSQCAECREYADDLRLKTLLRTLPIPEPVPGFESRILPEALKHRTRTAANESSSLGAWLALAASLVATIFVALQWQWSSTASVVPGQMVASEVAVRPIRLILNSKRDLDKVNLTVQLPPQVRLKGYGDTQRLQWSSRLATGDNSLVLPVQLRPGEARGMTAGDLSSEEIVIELEYEGNRKNFRVPLRSVFSGTATSRMI